MRRLEISDETYEKIKDQLTEAEKADLTCYNDMIGKRYFLRTVTYHVVGEVIGVFGTFIQLKNASWVADSGRFMDAILNGNLNEVEPIKNIVWNVNMSTVVDFGLWKHPLPRV